MLKSINHSFLEILRLNAKSHPHKHAQTRVYPVVTEKLHFAFGKESKQSSVLGTTDHSYPGC